MPKTEEAKLTARQLFRASSSVGANHRAACRARSKAGVSFKLSIVVGEADEAAYWIEIVIEADVVKLSDVIDLLDEANQLLKIVSVSRKNCFK